MEAALVANALPPTPPGALFKHDDSLSPAPATPDVLAAAADTSVGRQHAPPSENDAVAFADAVAAATATFQAEATRAKAESSRARKDAESILVAAEATRDEAVAARDAAAKATAERDARGSVVKPIMLLITT